MKKIEQTRTPEDFTKISRAELYKLWFGARLSDSPLTDRQIAKMYGVTKEEVKAKRKKLKIGWLSCGFMYVTSGDKYKNPKSPKNTKATKKKNKR